MLSNQPQIVKGFVLPHQTKEDGIKRLQNRFRGKLTVIKNHNGPDVVYSDCSATARHLEIFARFASLQEVSHYRH
ncbi:MAG TPA: hypothetical protein VGE31_02035 [Candidatus Paceibacterota bacterium]